MKIINLLSFFHNINLHAWGSRYKEQKQLNETLMRRLTDLYEQTKNHSYYEMYFYHIEQMVIK